MVAVNCRIPFSVVAGVSAACVLLAGAVRPRAAGCDPAGNVHFICNQLAPEDLVLVPGGDWVIASGMAANGAIRAISVRDRATTVLFPGAAAKTRPDTKTYPSCPGPLDPAAEKDKFRAHGLYIRGGRNGVHTMWMVHHGDRESIEVFELDARTRPPTLTWTGCAVAPDPVGLNSVVGLADGGFVTTNFSPRGQDAAARTKMMAGENNGELWEWHAARGWQKVPGSESAGANGLEISNDGKWLYIGGWGSQSVIRLSRGQTPVKRDSVPAGFRVDNVRMTPDGSILAAGQGGAAPAQTSHVGRWNPKTMTFQELIRYPYGDAFSFGTVAIQVGKEIWVGAVRGDRIAVFPATQQQSQ
jgi:sugar lactone lactonase YvrE